MTRLLLLVVALVSLGDASPSWASEWTEISDAKQRVVVAGFILDFGETDRNGAPISQGPIVVKDGRGHTCQVSEDVALIGWPVTMWRDRLLYVDTFSGEASRFFVVDLHTCRTIWRSPTYYGNSVFLPGKTLRLPGFRPWRIGADGLPTRRP